MVLRLQVRRFICADTSCGRQTFVEQIPGLTRRHAQRTDRLRSVLAEVGLASAPRVVGIDEYAMRKGRIYGTLLVDVEPGRPCGSAAGP
ncbi:hypothetical protein ACK8N7_35070 [Streptomyces griseobrunneus]|uniref:hypothetical protein n=1 Tax=Streptomyces microflavus TaxID=1919 RepID=UPI00380B2D42